MSVNVPTLREGKRGCGFRKPGGLYLVSDGEGEDCPLMPIQLRVCPTCGQGIKPARGWTWIEPIKLVKPGPHGEPEHYNHCPLTRGIERAGLIWIGDKFYSPGEFIAEAKSMGISRRISTLPREFKLGTTWVLLAHRKATYEACDCTPDSDGVYHTEPVDEDCPACGGEAFIPVPAIFYLFRPQRVEYVVKGDETEEELERMVKREIRPVKVEPVEAQAAMEVA